MSSQPRPCYQLLSQYTQNGINPIIAPTPSETKPQMFAYFKPHEFLQGDYLLHKKKYGTPVQAVNNCTNYVNISKMCGAAITPDIGSDVNIQYKFYPGFNEVGISNSY